MRKLEKVFTVNPDETLDIVSSYPVKLVAKNVKGVGAARHILTSASSSSLIAWIDADAAIPKNWLELRVKLHQTRRDVDCLSGTAMVVSILGFAVILFLSIFESYYELIVICVFCLWLIITYRKKLFTYPRESPVTLKGAENLGKVE